MTVVPFRRVPPPAPPPPVEPPPALTEEARPHPHSPPDADEDRQRMRQNLAALVAVVVLLALGAWLIDRLAAYSRTLACIEAGHRNCAKLDIEPPGGTVGAYPSPQRSR